MAPPSVTKLIEPTLLFEFEMPLRQTSIRMDSKRKPLPDSHLLPYFAAMGGHRQFARVWGAWSENGLHFDFDVERSTESASPISQAKSASAIRIWIDTRYDPTNRRATQFCHLFRFALSPNEKNPNLQIQVEPIPRAIGTQPKVDSSLIVFEMAPSKTGYRLQIGIPASILHGYSPTEVNHVGFFYEILEHPNMRQTLTLSPEFRYVEDPAFWCRAALTSSVP